MRISELVLNNLAPKYFMILKTVFSVVIIISYSNITAASAGEQCFIWKELKFVNCEWGCCGEDFDTYCCVPTSFIIAGCVGGLVIIAVVIRVACCCKKKGRAGRVIDAISITPMPVVGQQAVGHQGK